MKFKTELANKFYLSFTRTGNPYFYVLAVDTEKTENLRQEVLAQAEDNLTI